MLRRTIFLKISLVFVILMADLNSFADPNIKKATFAGGCFWCMESPFEKLKGVIAVVAGYAGGNGKNPTYNDYAQKGYVEAVEISFNPSLITYKELLDTFWKQINPTDNTGQFCDRGPQYRPVIFYHDEEQKFLAQESKNKLNNEKKFSAAINTEILPFSTFYPAEGYHQDYYKTHPVQYKFYRFSCGRDQFLKKVWGKE
ncbi:MAG: peptide-methionine (S)-S-oxide reductase MsrA [Candidatus Omnitrophica bacterium]|nr:peptide-methionine (S)-S-oxide reductase MsrA [Candidatus Omnitrophota bacterium]